jgi:transketolase
MAGPRNELSTKQLHALELISARNQSYRQIAKVIGWSEDYLSDLIAGDTQKCGSSALLFSEEVKKLDAAQAARIKELTKTTKEAILHKFEEFALEYKSKKTNTKVRKEMVSIMNSIGKSTPNVEIGSFTYARGLSAEDLVSEFKRLRGLSVNGSRISEPLQGEPGEIPSSEEPGSTA